MLFLQSIYRKSPKDKMKEDIKKQIEYILTNVLFDEDFFLNQSISLVDKFKWVIAVEESLNDILKAE